MNARLRWLLAEIERWERDGLVTATQATTLRARYAVGRDGGSWGLGLFFGFGAVVIGLGIILLLAYNWPDLPKFAKLALIFGGVAAAHVAGLRCRFAVESWQRTLGEALSLFGTMGYGAGIWLVAQIYHIDEHYPNGFLFWALGALAMAWALRSLSHALLATLLLTVWGGTELWGFSTPRDAAWIILVLGVGPLVGRLRSAPLTVVSVVCVSVLQVAHAAHGLSAAWSWVTVVAVGALWVGVEKWPAVAGLPGSRAVRRLGIATFLVALYVMGFADLSRAMTRPRIDVSASAWAVLPLVLALGGAFAAWGWVGWRARRDEQKALPLEEYLFPLGVVFAAVGLGMGVLDDTLFAIGGNLLLLALATGWMVRGCRETDAGRVVRGTVVLAAVVFARYFDLFDSLAARGLAFVIFGGILFAEGFYYRRHRASKVGEGGT